MKYGLQSDGSMDGSMNIPAACKNCIHLNNVHQLPILERPLHSRKNLTLCENSSLNWLQHEFRHESNWWRLPINCR